ncbi:glutamate synthase domain-containing protein 3 [Desulfohalotomaculum tongense]|uniref:GltB/FmdC/FwdC-like GXGXG domain-containing protein n=1 Tax=Desulforadius tongensis TaxID=1216062 RepID=UPI00195C1D44|nr:hypothetical protein [Desulforadius tongensis]MBM7855366.1 glutamate synthase domain-containing protein 3 [Desulforadius tongensis]
MRIDARGMYYRDLNKMIHQAVKNGETEIVLDNVNGQRYIGTGINEKVRITVNGVPGNDLAAFMNGPEITVYANAQDGIGNTMNDGTVVVHGGAGDVLGYAMRGGKIFIKGNVGYRVGIHMKEYQDRVPAIVVGGTAGDFFGEYMAGGILVVLGLNRKPGDPLTGDYLGTGMHGGIIYLRGEVERYKLGKEVEVFELNEEDEKKLQPFLEEYCAHFGFELEEVLSVPFCKLLPVSKRPYGRLYAY